MDSAGKATFMSKEIKKMNSFNNVDLAMNVPKLSEANLPILLNEKEVDCLASELIRAFIFILR